MLLSFMLRSNNKIQFSDESMDCQLIYIKFTAKREELRKTNIFCQCNVH